MFLIGQYIIIKSFHHFLLFYSYSLQQLTNVLFRLYYYGTISSVLGECDANQTVNLYLPDVFMFYDVNFMTSDVCSKAVTPSSLGYVPFYQKTTFTIKLDLIGATIANAVRLLFFSVV